MQTSYLTQVRKLKTLAVEAMKYYPMKIRRIDFIKYTANAIFRITDDQNKHYALRIHSPGYHTQPAIMEEISWLQHILKTTHLCVPEPIATTNKQYVVTCQSSSMSDPRFCAVFKWLPGKIRWKSIDKQYSYHLGAMIAQLQKNGQDMLIKHRYYWNAEGLVGTDRAKFYNIDKLTDVSKQEQHTITEARRLVYRILKQYEETHKDKTGLIHGDMQPNNFLFHKNHYAVIDFDDCGIGLYGDDLAVALFAFEYLTEGEKRKNFLELKDALFSGYSAYMPLTQEDIYLIPYFLLARKLITIGWLEARRVNPKLRSYFRQAVTRAIQFFKNLEN